MVGDVVALTQHAPLRSHPKGKATAEMSASQTFCPEPQLFRTPVSAPSAMGSCYPKCMGEPETQAAARARRPSTDRASSGLYSDNQAELLASMRTFDLEELGLSTEASVVVQETQLEVEYEENDEEHQQARADAAQCAPSACGLLEDKETPLVDSRRRLRAGSEAVAPTSGLKGKSVIFEQDKTPLEYSNSTTDQGDEPARCSKVHKLCMCELKLHRSLESCWLVSSGQVYDVTGLVTAHPGGERSILRKAGGPDCARDMKFHTKKARKMMDKCFIGKLEPCGDDADCSGDANCSIM